MTNVGPAPICPAEEVVGGGRDEGGGTDTPDQPPWAGPLGREEEALGRVSQPEAAALAGNDVPSWWIIGGIVREMTFQCSVSEIGTTGWMFRV